MYNISKIYKVYINILKQHITHTHTPSPISIILHQQLICNYIFYNTTILSSYRYNLALSIFGIICTNSSTNVTGNSTPPPPPSPSVAVSVCGRRNANNISAIPSTAPCLRFACLLTVSGIRNCKLAASL